MGAVLDRLRRRRRVAFVLSGGGNLGALQVGMLKALVERGIIPHHVIGCSVGALNGVAFAADPTARGVARLERAWLALADGLVMPGGWLPASVQLARKGEALYSNEKLRSLLTDLLDIRRFEDLELPFECVATRVHDAREVWFDRGPLIDPILASAAIPAVYPSVTIEGERYIDGGVVNDVPVSRAVDLGYRRIFILHVGNYDRPRPEPRRPLDVLVQSYWIARRHRFHRDLESLPPTTRVHILPTGHHPQIRYNDFSRSEDLIAQAYEATAARLDATSELELWSDRMSIPPRGEPSGEAPLADAHSDAELDAELEAAFDVEPETTAERRLRRMIDRGVTPVRRRLRADPADPPTHETEVST